VKIEHNYFHNPFQEIYSYSLHPPPSQANRGDRRAINAFSDSSRRSLVFACVNAPFAQGHCYQTALTYHEHPPSDGQTAKKHLNQLLTELRHNHPRTHYLWVMEFQKRGALHYHLFLPRTLNTGAFRSWIASAWNRITDETHPHLDFHESEKNHIDWELSPSYCAKYLSKSYQKDVPEAFLSCGRFWGCSRGFTGKEAPVHIVNPNDVSRLFPDVPAMVVRQKKKIMACLRVFRGVFHARLKPVYKKAKQVTSRIRHHKGKVFLHFGGSVQLERLFKHLGGILTWNTLYPLAYGGQLL